MTFHLLSLILAGILSFADYVTEHIFSEKLRKNQKLVSFSAGVAISYIILNLFPEISTYALIDGRKIFLYGLFGFVSLNLIEQYIYKGIGKLKHLSCMRERCLRVRRASSRTTRSHARVQLSTYHKNIHIIYFFIYNLFIGAILAIFASKGLAQTLLFFIPFLLYIIVEILPQEFKFKSNTIKVFYSMAPLFGTIFGINYISFVTSIFGELISFVTGTLLYIVIRESLPSDEAEKPLYFMIGVLFYTLIIFMSWNFV